MCIRDSYYVLPNGHDVVLMQKVSVISNDEDFRDYCDHSGDGELCDYVTSKFTPLMKEQYKFITRAFADSHDGNIGWDFKTNRVWYIDYNHGVDCGESSDGNRRKATRIMKRVTQSNRKAAAA